MSRHRIVRRKWLRPLGAALLAVVAALLVTGAVVVNLEHLKLEPVLSGSMRPGIQPGDLAIVRPVPVSGLHTGEVVAYLPPGQTTPVMHRIVSVDARGILTKGDANPVADPWGRVKPQGTSVEHLVAVVPKVGFLIDIRRQLLAVVGGVLLVVLALWLWPRGHKRIEEETITSSHGDSDSCEQVQPIAQTQGEMTR